MLIEVESDQQQQEEDIKPSSPEILIIEDSKTQALQLQLMLRSLNYNTTLVTNGLKAIEAIKHRPPALIISDLLMPEMDGYELLKHLKRNSEWRNIPVIVVTAIDKVDSAVLCIEQGAEDYLEKPFNLTLLKARVNACLEKKRRNDLEHQHMKEIEKEKQRYNELLEIILPPRIVEELQRYNTVKPRRFEDVAVLFCDVVSFTSYCDKHHPEEVIDILQSLVGTFEELTDKYHLEKIKTIGDAFMSTAGLLYQLPNSVENAIKCGIEMIKHTPLRSPQWEVRVGIHKGPVIGGIIGKKKYLFDIWGDTVNIAQRMQSLAHPNEISISSYAWQDVKDIFTPTAKSIVNVKGKGIMEVYSIEVLDED